MSQPYPPSPAPPPECAERVHESVQKPGAPGGGGVRGVKGPAGDQCCTETGSGRLARGRGSPTPPGGCVRSRWRIISLFPGTAAPRGLRIFSPWQPGVRRCAAPRAPALQPRPLARHLSSGRHCQQPRLASWTTPKGTRGLGPERSKQGGFIPVPFGGDLEQNRKAWGGEWGSCSPVYWLLQGFYLRASPGPWGRGSGGPAWAF